MTDAVLQIDSSFVEDAEDVSATEPQSATPTTRVVGVRVFSAPRRARAVHDELTSTSFDTRMAFYDECPLWDASTKKRLRPVVDYSVSRIRPREAWAAVANQVQDELNNRPRKTLGWKSPAAALAQLQSTSS